MNRSREEMLAEVKEMGRRERASTALQFWWMTQRHEPLLRDYADDMARAALEAADRTARKGE